MAEFNCSLNFKYYHLQFYSDETWRYTIGIFLACISPLTIAINVLVLITMLRYNVLKTPSFKMLVSLALSDLLTGAIVAPITSVQLLKTYTKSDCVVDMACIYLELLFIGTSALTLGCISYDRYLHLSQLSNYKMPKRKLYVFLLMCWLIPICAIVIAVVDFYISSIVIVILSALVMLTIITSYVSVLVALGRHAKRSNNTLRKSSVGNEQRAGRMVIIILSFFLLMFLCYIISFLLEFTRNFDDVFVSKCFIIATCIGVFNSCINPIIITYNTPAIGRCLKMMLGMSATST